MAATQLANKNTPSNTYYRSHLYTSYHGINPLVTAAHPLLSIIDRIQLSTQLNASSEFYQNLQYELKVLESRMLANSYDEETIFIAHFLLSATIHEKLNEKKFDGGFKKLMPPNQNPDEVSPEDKFFEVVNKVIDKPEHYLDLIELIYLCLSLGFEGKYRHQEHQKLKQIMEKVYSTITTHRSTKQNDLFQQTEQHQTQTTRSEQWQWQWLGIILFTLGSVYSLSNWLLEHKTSNLIQSSPAILSE
jgi:type VI secretion system protein ImpK